MTADCCPACGEGTIASARFCHSCGSSLSVPVVNITRSSGRPSVDDGSRSGLHRATVVLGVMALIVAVGALLFADTPDSEDSESQAIDVPAAEPVSDETAAVEVSPPPSPTPEVILTERDRLVFAPAITIAEMWPLAIGQVHETIYLFGTSQRAASGTGGGLYVWQSDHSTIDWRALGEVIPAPHRISSVSVGTHGMIALGIDGVTGEPTAWQSANAEAWTPSALPTAGLFPVSQVSLNASSSVGNRLVIFGNQHPDIVGVVRDALPEELKGASGYDLGWGGLPLRVTVQGPLGLTVFSTTGEELGLSRDEEEALFSDSTAKTMVWSSTDLVTWETSQLDHALWVDSVYETTGGMVAAGYGSSGLSTWVSVDGVEWERDSGTRGVGQVNHWRDLFVGIGLVGPSADLMWSKDGSDWTSFEMRQLLDQDLAWNLGPLAAGNAGLAVVAQGYDDRESSREYEPLVLERDGYTVIKDEMQGRVQVMRGDEEVLSFRMGSQAIHDGADVDFIERTVTFVDLESGAELVSFTFDEIEAAQQAAYAGTEPDGEHLLMFSPDGTAWSVQPIDSDQAQSRVSLVHVTDHSVLTVTETVAPYSRTPQPPTVQIAVAPIS